MTTTILTRDLFNVVNLTHPCIDDSAARFALHGVRFEHSKDNLIAVGSDGRKLAKVTASTGGDEIEDCVVDLRNLYRSRNSLPRAAKASANAEINETPTSLEFSWKNTKGKEFSTNCPKVEHFYPKWRNVFPLKNPIGDCSIDVKEWLDAWKDYTDGPHFELAADGDRLITKAHNPPGFRIDMATGQPIKLTCRLEWIMDHLSRLPNQSANLQYYGPAQPLCIKSPICDYLIMPVN